MYNILKVMCKSFRPALVLLLKPLGRNWLSSSLYIFDSQNQMKTETTAGFIPTKIISPEYILKTIRTVTPEHWCFVLKVLFPAGEPGWYRHLHQQEVWRYVPLHPQHGCSRHQEDRLSGKHLELPEPRQDAWF